MLGNLRVLLVGDVVGQLGCAIFQKHIDRIKQEHKIDAIILNGENSHFQGRGITPGLMNFFKYNGVNVVTSGNHIWARKEIYSYLEQNNDLLRPANFPGMCPGVGVTTFTINGYTIGVINLQGRIFMNQFVDCPFRTAESLLTLLKQKTKIIFVDFHAEATSEKMGMGYFLDGKVSGVVGTHTHVQTADNRILPNGTGYITDLGMCGALNSMIGMRKEPILQNFLCQMPVKFEVDLNPPALMCGVIIEVNPQTGKAVSIDRLRIVDESIKLDSEGRAE